MRELQASNCFAGQTPSRLTQIDQAALKSVRVADFVRQADARAMADSDGCVRTVVVVDDS